MSMRLALRLATIATFLAVSACAHLDQPRDYVVYFDSDSAVLTPGGMEIVRQVAATAHDVSPSKIVVAGRADGSTAHDAALADQRATAVMQALATQGITPAKIEKQPDAPPASRTGVAAHQVVITLLP